MLKRVQWIFSFGRVGWGWVIESWNCYIAVGILIKTNEEREMTLLPERHFHPSCVIHMTPYRTAKCFMCNVCFHLTNQASLMYHCSKYYSLSHKWKVGGHRFCVLAAILIMPFTFCFECIFIFFFSFSLQTLVLLVLPLSLWSLLFQSLLRAMSFHPPLHRSFIPFFFFFL